MIMGYTDANFSKILLKPDNFPIVLLIYSMFFYIWWGMKQAYENDSRIAEGKKPNEYHDACYQSTNQPACETNPGCWWEDGYDDMGGWQFSEPYCYFDCPGLDSAECSSLSTECSWTEGGSSG